MFKFAHDPPIDVGAGGSDTQDGMMAMTSVLLAEDDPFIPRVSEVSLKRAGFTVRSVGDGTEALQLLEDGLVDLVILDGLMPTMLELGADDYLIKPFEPGVLVSRVRAAFRRASRHVA